MLCFESVRVFKCPAQRYRKFHYLRGQTNINFNIIIMESLDSMLRDNESFTDESRSYLAEAAKWGTFLAIMGYIGLGLMVLMGVGIMAGGAAQSFGGLDVDMGAFGLIYIAIAGLYFFPVYYLHQFSLKIKQASYTTGFQNLKSLFKFMGILCIVMLSIYAVVIVGAIGAALIAR